MTVSSVHKMKCGHACSTHIIIFIQENALMYDTTIVKQNIQVRHLLKKIGSEHDNLLIMKVVFFGDNVPKDRADKAMEAAKGCDAFLVLGSSLMTMSAFRLVR